MDDASAAAKNETEDATPLLEWVAGAIGAVLFAAALAITLTAAAGGSAPPAITVRVEAATAQDDGYLVAFEAANSGDATAANVEIKAVLKRAGDIVETREASVASLPPHSTRRGAIVFETDPAGLETLIRVEGFELP